jgi:hypothetical protein
MNACTQGQVFPVIAFSPRTTTSTSTLDRNAAVTRASSLTTSPTLIGCSNARSSMPAVTVTEPQ